MSPLLSAEGFEHEGVVGGGRGEFYVRRNTLVGVYDRMYLYAALLFAGLGMSAYSFEKNIGE